MGGISFYKKKGAHLARKANGPDKARIMSDPKFERTRENLSEFGGAASAVASFLKVFSPVKNLRDGEVRNRLVKLLRTIMKRSDGVRGQREILLSQHRELLLNMELNASQYFTSSFAAKVTTSHNAERTSATVSVTDLKVKNMVSAPPAATHFQLVQLVGIVADTVYNDNLKAYEPAHAALDTLSDVTFSDYIPVRGNQPVSLTLDTSLAEATSFGQRRRDADELRRMHYLAKSVGLRILAVKKETSCLG